MYLCISIIFRNHFCIFECGQWKQPKCHDKEGASIGPMIPIITINRIDPNRSTSFQWNQWMRSINAISAIDGCNINPISPTQFNQCPPKQ